MIGRVLSRARPPDVAMVAPMMPMGPWPFASDVLMDPLPMVTEAEARDLPVVSAALAMLCSLILQMRLQAHSGVNVIPTPQILRNPAPGGNRVLHDWLCETLTDLLLFGNAFAVLGDPGRSGWPDMMYPVPWGSWSMRDDGYYQVGSDVYRPQDVFHVRRNCRTGEHMGRGLLQTHARLVAGAVAAERWAQQYYDGGACPPVAVTNAGEMTQEQAEMLKLRFDTAAKQRKAVITQTGTTITPLNSDADGAQLNESRRWGAQQLAMALQIPGALLGLDSPSLTYKNITDVFSQWISTTVMGYLVPIEMQLTSQCLPRNVEAKFDVSAVLRPDLAGRVALATQGLAGGIFTTTEARQMVDLPDADPANLQAPQAPPAAATPAPTPALSLVPGATP